MTAYYILVLLPVLFYSSSKYMNNRFIENKKDSEITTQGTITIFFIFLILMMSCRNYFVGVDTKSNLRHFHEAQVMTIDQLEYHLYTYEKGFLVFLKTISLITNNDQLFIAISAICIIIPIFLLYKKEAEMPILCISLYLIMPSFQMCFSGMRQSLAMSVSVLSFYFVKKHKLLWFFLSVILASLFHQSALILFIMYPVYYAKIKKKLLVFVVPIIVLFYYFNSSIYLFMLRFLGEKYNERYGEISSTGAVTMLILFIVLSVYSFVISDESKMNEETFGLRNLLLMSVLLQCFAPVNPIAMRMNYYYLLFLPLTISKISHREKDNLKSINYIAIIVMEIFFLAYFIWKGYYGADTLEIFPYIPFWESV